MASNLGKPRLSGFVKMIAAVKAGNWDNAANEALNNKWATQTGHRALEIADMLKFGH